jgi:DNA-binding Lrp family transcriptional regulator
MKLDEIDFKILNILQANGRITNVQLSNEIGLSPAPTLERVKKLEHAGFIESYHALLNGQKLGLGVTVFLEVSLNTHKENAIEQFMNDIQKLPEVVECYHITGTADFLLKIYAENIAAYQNILIHKIGKTSDVGHVHSKIVLGVVKKSMQLPISPSIYTYNKG